MRERATRLGAVLIFDEMVTGFRWHAGGYQALCGVTPDLATFGKAMGNGYPISALVGRADLMQWARLASGTFGGDCVGLAAADAVLERYSARASDMVSVTDHMWRIGADLIDGYNRIAEKLGAPTRMEGQPPHPVIRWDEEQEADPLAAGGVGPNRWRASLFFQEAAARPRPDAGPPPPLFHPDGINIMLAQVLGSGLTSRQVWLCILTSLAIACTLLAALSPVLLFFELQLPSPDSPGAMSIYQAVLLVNTAAVGIAGIIGNIRLYRLLRAMTKSTAVAARVLTSWILVTGLTGCELSWVLSPFLAKPGIPIPLINPDAFNGNFFEYCFRTLRALAGEY